jgi:hypothetical protein
MLIRSGPPGKLRGSVPLCKEGYFFRRRLAAKDFIAVRKAPEALDDLDIAAPVTTQRTSAIGISRQGFKQTDRAALVGDIFAVVEWHIEK